MIHNITSLVIVILLCTAALVRPGLYRKRALDCLEYFFLLNLAFLLVGILYSGGHDEAIFDVSVGLAFLAFVTILVHHVLLKIEKYHFYQRGIAKVKVKLSRIPKFSSGNRAIRPTTQTLGHFPLFVAFDGEREPLLANSES